MLRLALAASFSLTLGPCGMVTSAPTAGESKSEPRSAATAPPPDGGQMSGHMVMTTLRPAKTGDVDKAKTVVEGAKAAMAPYRGMP